MLSPLVIVPAGVTVARGGIMDRGDGREAG